MIKIDYTIERNEGNEVKIFKPNQIPNQLDNIVYIQGPNSSGKSTLLNLIALAFYGNKLQNDDIDTSLSNKISNLMNLDHQKLIFDITIDNPEMGITLVSQKQDLNNLDICVKKIIDGKETQLSAESFIREFKLIYDIPHDPLERLPQLLSEVKVAQKEVGQRIELLREYLRNLIEEINNSRDPKALANLKHKYDYLKTDYDSIEHDIKNLKLHAKKVLEYGLSKTYITYFDNLNNGKATLDDINKQIEAATKDQRKKAKVQTSILIQKEKIIDDCQSKYKEAYQLLTPLVSKTDQAHFKLWKQSVLHDEIYHPDVHTTLRGETKYFINTITETLEQERMTGRKDLNAIELYKILVSILSDQKFTDITLPGINQTVEAFLSIIIKELNTNEYLIDKLNRLENCEKSLECFIESLEKAINTIQELKEVDTPDDDGINIDGLKNEKTTVENQIRFTENKERNY